MVQSLHVHTRSITDTFNACTGRLPAAGPRLWAGEEQGVGMAGHTELVGFQGELLDPRHPGYDGARRLWNGAIDKRPALIARCTGPADVRAGIELARAGGLPLAVRGGGHNVAGTASCDGGLVLDLSPMK
jgi:FAD binding domain